MDKRYFVLGKEASIFYDSAIGMMVRSKDKDAPDTFEGSLSKKADTALKHGHIVEVDAPNASGSGSGKVNLKKMKDEELMAFYKENFQVTEEDEKTFKALSKAEKIKFLEEE